MFETILPSHHRVSIVKSVKCDIHTTVLLLLLLSSYSSLFSLFFEQYRRLAFLLEKI